MNFLGKLKKKLPRLPFGVKVYDSLNIITYILLIYIIHRTIINIF